VANFCENENRPVVGRAVSIALRYIVAACDHHPAGCPVVVVVVVVVVVAINFMIGETIRTPELRVNKADKLRVNPIRRTMPIR
jgi:hypothetical protein